MIAGLHGLVGITAGLHSAAWGAYKDSPYERFELAWFLRSPALGLVIGALAGHLLERHGREGVNLAVFMAFVMVLERLFTEGFKSFVRDESQAKYRIPSRFHILGKVVGGRWQRSLLGILIMTSALLFFALPAWVQPHGGEPNLLYAVLWATLAGVVIAVCGAWKDAPVEGFHPVKFLRSIAVTALWGAIFSFATSDYSLLLCASMGAERMTVEFHKTFVVRRPPGKFKATAPTHPEWIDKRKALLVSYVFTWIAFAALLIAT